jgi:hypothetical protein
MRPVVVVDDELGEQGSQFVGALPGVPGEPLTRAAGARQGAGFACVDAMIAVARVSPGMGVESHGGETRPYARRASHARAPHAAHRRGGFLRIEGVMSIAAIGGYVHVISSRRQTRPHPDAPPPATGRVSRALMR